MRTPQAETQDPVRISQRFKVRKHETRFLKQLGFHKGSVIRYREVHVNTWRALSHYVVMGLVTVRREYGIPTARLTPKGEVVLAGRKPGPKPGHGGKGPLVYTCNYAVAAESHWTVKLMVQLCAERRVSIRQLSKGSGLAEGTIKNWLRKCQPTIDKIEAVLHVFDLNLAAAQTEWERRTKEQSHDQQA